MACPKDLSWSLCCRYCTRPRLATLSEVMAYISFRFYADDIQLYCSFKLHDQAASVQAFESSLNDIDAWMLANMLKLNRDKTELLVIGPKHKVNPPIKGIHVAGEYIEVSNNARNIPVSVIFYFFEFISSKLDFCNAHLYGLPQSVIDRLQYVQNCAARLVTRTRSSEHINI